MIASPELRADALFVSALQPSTRPSRAQINTAIDDCLARLGVAGCLAAVATEYGEHPDTAIRRMRWALASCAPSNL